MLKQQIQRRIRPVALFAAVLLAAAPAWAEMAWWQASQWLQEEKGAAVNCARTLKRLLPQDDEDGRVRAEFDYEAVEGLSNELKQKLAAAQPATLARARSAACSRRAPTWARA